MLGCEQNVTNLLVCFHLPLYKRGIEGNLSNKISPNPSFQRGGLNAYMYSAV